MTILHIDSSITGEQSASRAISRSIIDQLRALDPNAEVVTRDLVSAPLPHLTLDAFADTSVLDEFLAADTIVIGAPMYNFTIPTQLKAWLDRLAVAGRSFRYTENGPEGLLGGKRVIVALASGGVYSDDSPFEHVRSYLTAFFRFIGIEPEFVDANGVALGVDDAIAGAGAQIERLAA